MTEDLSWGSENESNADVTASDARQGDVLTGSEGAETLIGQAAVLVEAPAAVAVVPIPVQAGQRYVIDFDPSAAQIRVAGDDLVLTFANGGQIIFQGIGAVDPALEAPIFEIAGADVPAAVLYQQAVALAGPATTPEGTPTLETAAGPAGGPPGPQGTGGTRYDDDTGQIIPLLNKQGVIPGVEGEFGLIALENLTPLEEPQAEVVVPAVSVDVRIGPLVGPVVIKEDSPAFIFDDSEQGAVNPEHMIEVVATATNGVLTTIVIAGLDPAWDYDLTGLLTSGATLSDADFSDGNITINLTGLGLTSYSGSFVIVPTAATQDSDIDIGTLTATAGAVSTIDPTLTATAVDTTEVIVDAVLDFLPEITQGSAPATSESDTVQTLGLALNFTASATSAGFPFSTFGGTDDDGSESVTKVEIQISAGVSLVFDGSQPAGVSLVFDSGTGLWQLTGYASNTELGQAINALSVEVPTGFGGDITGTIFTTTAEANTPQGAAPGSGLEPFETDNVLPGEFAFTATVRDAVGKPDVSISVSSDAGFFKEDLPSDITLSASVENSTDELTSLVVTGLTWGVSAGELSDLEALADVASATFAAGTLTITFVPGVESFYYTTLTLTPPEDTDVDLTGVAATANARDKTTSALTDSATANATFIVDAILDDAADVTQTSVPSVDESTSGDQTILLHLDFSVVSAGFTGSGAGGTDEDGSESVTSVTIHISAGALVLDVGYAGTASLSDLGGGDYELTGWTDLADLEAAVEGLSVTVSEGFDGTITGSLSMTTKEANTPQGTVLASGDEPDTADNTVTNDVPFSVVINPTTSDPTVSLTVNGEGIFKEDTSNDVTISAAVGDSTDQLTTVIVTGLTWGVSAGELTELIAHADVATATFAAGTLTITFEPGVGSFNYSTLTLTPPEDTDADLSGVQITANVEDKTDSSATGSVGDTVTLVVDAILDHAADPTQTSVPSVDESTSGDQTIPLNLKFSMANAGFPGSGAGGADTDGSELVTSVTIHISGGTLVLDAGYAGTASLSNLGGGDYELAGWMDFADLEAAVEGLSVTVAAGVDGIITGTLSMTTAEANTPPGSTVPASGLEPDTADNTINNNVPFSVEINPTTSEPTVSLTVNGAGIFKEDTSNDVTISAAVEDSTDQLTTVVVTSLTWGVSAGELTELIAHADVATATFAAGTLTITFEPGVGSFNYSTLTLTPPEDTDVDLSGVQITANVEDKTDSSATGSASDTVTLVMDAILDHAADPTQTSIPEVNEDNSNPQTIPLNLEFSMANAGFTGSGAGGADTDGSELVTSVTVQISAGELVLDVGYAGAASLSNLGGGDYELTGWTDLADLEAAVEALSVSVTAGFDGTITGTLSMTTAEANTPQSNAPLSGAEPDTTDNTVTNNVPFSLAVDSVPTAGNTNIAVDEDDLPSGNHDVALGDDLPNGSPTSITGNLNFSYEADSVGGTIDFAALNGIAVQDTLANPVSSDGTALTYYWDAGSKTLYASKDTTNLTTAQSTAVFLVVVTNMATGAYQFDLLAPVEHPMAGTEDNITISIGFTVTDGDGDAANGTLTVNIDDDSPAVLAKTDLIFANSSNPTPGGTGVFDYSIGADERAEYSASSTDFSAIVLSGMVGSVNISTPIVIQTSEDANSAVFAVSFSYAANPLTPGVLTAATGTLTFDKVSGTYTMALDQQIESFTVLTTSNTISKESFDLVVQGVSQPEVVVSKLADGFFARFSADHAVQGGSPVPLHAGTLNSDLSFVAGDLFSAAQTWVSISGSQNGVASDTLQKGEVLDMQFYTSSPGGSATPGQGDALASGMFLKLAKLNAGEDIVIILRLIDPDTSAITTRAIVVDYGDIWLSSQINPYGIIFADGSDGVIIIESNDYNINVGDNWLIYGAQLLVSTENVMSATNAAIDLNRNTGDTGGSTFGETLGGDTVDSDVIKVVDIGIITATTSTQDTHLSFGFQVIDGDGDATSTQTLNVVIEGSTTFVGTAAAESIQGSSGVDTISDGAGADIIRGGNGADIINLTADGTSDVLVYNLLSEAGDVVTNFNTAAPGAGGDVLDISDLLDLGTFAGTTTAQAIAGQYLQVIDSGGNALVQVDLDGAAGGNSWTTMVTLNSMIATNVLDDNIVVD